MIYGRNTLLWQFPFNSSFFFGLLVRPNNSMPLDCVGYYVYIYICIYIYIYINIYVSWPMCKLNVNSSLI